MIHDKLRRLVLISFLQLGERAMVLASQAVGLLVDPKLRSQVHAVVLEDRSQVKF